MPCIYICPCSYWLALSIDLADTHGRSICLGRPDEPNPPGSNSCDLGLDPPRSQKISLASCVSTSELWSNACPRSRGDCQSELHLQYE
jgi:hypothetical protein